MEAKTTTDLIVSTLWVINAMLIAFGLNDLFFGSKSSRKN